MANAQLFVAFVRSLRLPYDLKKSVPGSQGVVDLLGEIWETILFSWPADATVDRREPAIRPADIAIG